MAKTNVVCTVLITSLLVLSTGLSAQETEVRVSIMKDGKQVEDTTYRFESDRQAMEAVKLLGLMSGDMKKGLKEELVWIEEDTRDGEERVIIMRSGDGETFDELVDVDEDMEKEIRTRKKVKVMVSEDDDSEWEILEKELEEDHEDIDVIIIRKKPEKEISKKQ